MLVVCFFNLTTKLRLFSDWVQELSWILEHAVPNFEHTHHFNPRVPQKSYSSHSSYSVR